VNRRQVIAAVAGLGLTGGSFWVSEHGLLSGHSRSEGQLPIRVETLDARGSTAGEALVPTPDTVTVVDLFATWCAPCDDQLDALQTIQSEYEEVSFISVTNERPSETLTRDDIADWWNRHDGAWTVGLDPQSDLMSALGANGLPYIVIVDSKGDIRFDHSGLAGEALLRAELDELT
jgi:thiol-disulfide isomerase/thioredoxin